MGRWWSGGGRCQRAAQQGDSMVNIRLGGVGAARERRRCGEAVRSSLTAGGGGCGDAEERGAVAGTREIDGEGGGCGE